jgi:hypothetical protein
LHAGIVLTITWYGKFWSTAYGSSFRVQAALPEKWFSLSNLWVLCFSVVHFLNKNNHRDTENPEVSQRRSPLTDFSGKALEL